MKRKLDEGNIPSPPRAVDNTAQGGGGTFATLGLDPRLLQSIAHEKFASPTLVQAKAIPLALIGKDILGRYCHSLLRMLF
jgi:ATP-dependent RNA helicase DDX56/DBP9